jgi:hypothetical protein
MQNFKAAADLGITEPQKEALMKTLVLLETGRLIHTPLKGCIWDENPAKFSHEFNMAAYIDRHDCGTVACISGTATLISGVNMSYPRPDALDELFYAYSAVEALPDITPAQAATALRSYLTTGDARWDLAVA